MKVEVKVQDFCTCVAALVVWDPEIASKYQYFVVKHGASVGV